MFLRKINSQIISLEPQVLVLLNFLEKNLCDIYRRHLKDIAYLNRKGGVNVRGTKGAPQTSRGGNSSPRLPTT